LIVSQSIRENLDRYLTIELRIPGTVHLAHPAGPEGSKYLVRAEVGANR
jgi:hypothetical protein